MTPNPLKRQRVYAFGTYTVDCDRATLRRLEERVSLPPKVFETLCLLVEAQGELVSKVSMMESLWPESFVEESSLSQNIFLLRRALGSNEEGREYIETVSKRGYRLAVPVRVLERALPDQPKAVVPVAVEPRPVAQTPPTSEAAVEQAAPQSPAEVQSPAVVASSRSTGLPEAGQAFERKESDPSLVGSRGRLFAVIGAATTVLFAAILCVLLLWLGHRQPTVSRFKRLTNDGQYKGTYPALMTDGNQIFFTETVAARSYLAEVSVNGGETMHHALLAPSEQAFSYSPQRNEILFGTSWESNRDQMLSIMSLPAETINPVGILTAHGAGWAPDGQSFVYVSGSRLLTARADGQNQRVLAQVNGVPFWPRWSPDGTRIRFSMYGFGEEPGMWEVSAAGGEPHPLFKHEPMSNTACCGEWSPDGRFFAFLTEDLVNTSLWVVRDHASWWQSAHPSLLAAGPVDYWRGPSFAADGKTLFAVGAQARGHLIKYDSINHEFRPFLNQLSTDTISFSPNGKWIAYTAYPEGTLWRSRTDGSERTKLSPDGHLARFPEWSPDGSQISFIMSTPQQDWKMFTVPAIGGVSKLCLQDETDQGVGTWSPDGTRLAFGQIINFGVEKKSTTTIKILDLKRGQVAEISGSSDLWTARWSPDGRYLAAVGAQDGRLMLYDFSTGAWSEAADNGTNDVVWTRDGRSLYFDSTREPTLFKYTPSSGQLTRYADLKNIRRAGFYRWTVNVAPDGEPVLLEDAGVEELYSLQVDLP